VSEVDDDQLAALRRLRIAFGFVEVVEVVSHDPAAAADESIQGARMAEPGRMTPEEQASPRAPHPGAERSELANRQPGPG
jgi:hypothetical protein